MASERPPYAGSSSPPLGSAQEADEYDSPLFKSDEFRLWCMKVIPCTKRFVHDWTVCPFAHAGEKAVRRDPRLYSYTGIACPDMKKTGSCIRGDKCPYAHNVFEYWLHPTRYRTQLCNDGPMCRRSICFFAHSLEELRVPACKPYVSPEALARASLEAIQANPHPLGQELPNPVMAAQQQAAMAALGRAGGPQGGRGGRGSLAPGAQPFVPGGSYEGSHMHSGSYGGHEAGHQRYSAPSGPQLLASSLSASNLSGQADFNNGMPSMHSAGDFSSGGQGGGGGGGQSYHALQAAQQQRWMAQQAAASQQHHSFGSSYGPALPAGEYGTPPDGAAARSFGGRGGGAPPMHRGGPASAPNGAYFPSAPARTASPAGGHRAFASFAAVQQPPPRGFGAPQGFGSYQATPEPSQPSLGGAQGSGSVSGRTSRGGSDEDGEGSRSSGAPGGAPGSGRASPAAACSGDLAQSLASLKIALTQQQLAAAAGSNHEVVISTLHQILKDAMASQQSGGAPGGNADAAAAALLAAAGLAKGTGSGSPNGAASANLSSGPSTIASSLGGSVVVPHSLQAGGGSDTGGESQGTRSHSPQPALGTSPDALACYQAAVLAAAGGFPGVLGSGRRSASPRGGEPAPVPVGLDAGM